MRTILAAGLILAAVPAAAQPAPEITFYEYPAYLGRSVTVRSAIGELSAQSIVRRAGSARVTGEWTVCPEARFRGACRELTRSTPTLNLGGSSGAIVSLRPAVDDRFDDAGEDAGDQRSALEDLDADAGVEGQDVAFFARPSFNGVQVGAGANDRAAATAFCEAAGYAAVIHAGRARVRAGNVIDSTTGSRLRAFPLRDVLCRR